MSLPRTARKLVLSVHLTASIGWIGGVIVYLALGATALATGQDEIIRAAWIAMEITGWYVLVPMAVTTILTGLALALGTRWGLWRHYWVVISFLLTVIAAVVMVLHMPDVTAAAAIARTADSATLRRLGGDLVHPAIGLAVLLAVQVLNIVKPAGLTRYGWRAARAARPAA